MADGGWKNEDIENADDKIRMKNDDIATRGKKFAIFSHILSCKIRPREFIHRNSFHAGYGKKSKDFDQGT